LKKEKIMSRILVPSKPSWKITIIVDNRNQAQIEVEDLQRIQPNPVVTGAPVAVSRSMNQIELALLLTNIVSSTLVNTLNVSGRKELDGTQENRPH
jgi:hypothetical protein